MRFLLGRATPIVLAVVGLACGDTDIGTPPDYPDADATVFLRDNYFSPDSVTIPANGTVLFRWAGTAGHDIYYGPNVSQNCGLRSIGYCVGPFPQPGAFYYICNPHAAQGMRGVVGVTP